jgi:hypothetical protein
VKSGHTRAELFDDTRHLEAKHSRLWLLSMCCLSGSDFGIEWVDAACVDSHRHLAAPGRWASDFNVHERSFGMLDEVCSHRLSER